MREETTFSAPVEIGPEEKLQAFRRVLNSHTFSRSEQLKRFLQYICEKEIEGNGAQINEYSIATETLGRSAHYSPTNDSSVRTRAHAHFAKSYKSTNSKHCHRIPASRCIPDQVNSRRDIQLALKLLF